jgi:hypothetical protein
MQQESTASGNRRYLLLSLGVALGCVAAFLMAYVLYGPDEFVYHFFLSLFCSLCAFLYLKRFRPEQFRKIFGPKSHDPQ